MSLNEEVAGSSKNETKTPFIAVLCFSALMGKFSPQLFGMFILHFL